jgi:hypothetical protein
MLRKIDCIMLRVDDIEAAVFTTNMVSHFPHERLALFGE